MMKKKTLWFRFYTEALDDPKVQRLPPHLFKTWVNLLCLACANGGKFPSLDDIGFRLRMSAHDLQQQFDELVLADLIDIGNDGKRAPHNWVKRQFVSDTSTERVRKHRQNKEKQECNVDETFHETPPETETETETETENKIATSENEAEHAGGREEIQGLNGSTAEIVGGVAKLLNNLAPDYETAKRIVTSNVGFYGPVAVRDGYAELMADIADNKVVIPSAKTLLGYVQTASKRPSKAQRGRQPADYASQRIERSKAFMDLINEERAA